MQPGKSTRSDVTGTLQKRVGAVITAFRCAAVGPSPDERDTDTNNKMHGTDGRHESDGQTITRLYRCQHVFIGVAQPTSLREYTGRAFS